MRQELPAIVRVPVVFVNAYLVDITPGVIDDGWVLVDTGLRGLGDVAVRRAASARYGPGSRPRAIVLTHGHFDHAGSAAALAERWGVPVFAHRLELPYLTGRSEYPPPDPTVGGALAMMSRTFPHGGPDLSGHLHALPTDETVPFLPGWRAIDTPGHTPGHESLWREHDGTLLAGDALATMNQESWTKTVTMPQELRWPPIPLTCDWDAARASVRRLAALRPRRVAAGHGLPMAGDYLAEAVEAFARGLTPPAHGRYVREPARAYERCVFAFPPPVADPVGSTLRA
ncbi:MAG: MBL fold metallo-hydrolase, partial [Acidobacteria bacterium]|nr:MBL fold metallo-hydrolase [Acidobacteriota bacterium]